MKDIKQEEKAIEKEKNIIISYYNEVRIFLIYLFSDEYKNQQPKTSNNDELLIAKFSILKDKEKEMKKYFTLVIRLDKPSGYNKTISFLWGKWMIHFRRHKPFESTLYMNEELIDNPNVELLLNNIKKHTKEHYKISL